MSTKSMPIIEAFYNDTAIENWTCVNMVEYYHAKSGKRNLKMIMDCIKKDLQVVADPNSEFEITRKRKAREILDDWKRKLGLLVSSDELLVRRLAQAGTAVLLFILFFKKWSTQKKNLKRSSGVNIESLQDEQTKDQPQHTPPHQIFSSDGFVQQQSSNERSNGQEFSDSDSTYSNFDHEKVNLRTIERMQNYEVDNEDAYIKIIQLSQELEPSSETKTIRQDKWDKDLQPLLKKYQAHFEGKSVFDIISLDSAIED
ncbi:15527_t:CDS:2, partial [Acaulospora colombiana]